MLLPHTVGGTLPPAPSPARCHQPRRLALALGDATAQQLPLAAAANELYKRVGWGAGIRGWLPGERIAVGGCLQQRLRHAAMPTPRSDRRPAALSVPLQARAAGYSDADFSAVMAAVASRK